MPGDHDNRQCGSSNMTLTTSALNNNNTVKDNEIESCQMEDVVSAEVVAMIVVAVVVMFLVRSGDESNSGKSTGKQRKMFEPHYTGKHCG